MKILFTCFLFLFVVAVCLSQERLINGKITDGGNDSFQSVKIQIINQDVSTTSDTDGYYKIAASPGDVLFYSAEGMEPVQIRVEDVTRTLNLELFPRVEKLENVTVTKKRRNSQKELEIDYASNPNIIKTAFGFLNKEKASYSTRILDNKDFLQGEYDLVRVLRGRFAGVTVLRGATTGVLTIPGDPEFNALSTQSSNATVLIRGKRAIYDVDGQIFTDFPDFIDVQNIERIAIIASAAGTVRYGNVGSGGVVVINTKTGTIIPKDKNNLVIDGARLLNNYYTGTALTEADILKNAPNYLKELNSSNSFEEAKAKYESNVEKYRNSPYFILDSYQYFFEKWDQEAYADRIIEDGFSIIGNNPLHLKALAYIYDSQERYELANEAYKEVFILRPNYAQSYRDLALSNRNINEPKKAAMLYARYFYLLDENFMQTDTSSFSKILNREFNNLLALEKTDMMNRSAGKKIKVENEDFKGTRLVFEWNNSEAEFDLQFLNPDNQYYTWNHSLEANADTIATEKNLGYSCSEYLIDDSLAGTWKVNIKYLGNKSLTPTYLKAKIYHNYGEKSQYGETKVFKLNVKNANRQLFNITKNISVASK
ncbi:MAG: hypothetical protein AAF348_16745 [Bacteroidota bacterium]